MQEAGDEGPLVLCPRSLRRRWLSPGRASLHCPLVLGGGSSPPESCHHGPLTVVLQLSLLCVPGDLLAASSGKPRPQTPPALWIETPLPRSECSPAAPACSPALCTRLSPAQHAGLACPSTEPFPRIPGPCLLCSQQPCPCSPAGTWHRPCPSLLSRLAPAQA